MRILRFAGRRYCWIRKLAISDVTQPSSMLEQGEQKRRAKQYSEGRQKLRALHGEIHAQRLAICGHLTRFQRLNAAQARAWRCSAQPRR